MAYLVVDEGSSHKFWSIKIDGSKTHVSYGKIGSAGQHLERDHGTPEKAKQFASKLIAEKKSKGYREGDAASGGSQKKTAAGKKRQSRTSDDDDDDGGGSAEGGNEEEDDDDEDDDDDEPKPKRTPRELAAVEQLEATVRLKLAPHRSAVLRGLQNLAACSAWKKAAKVLFEIQPDGLQHPGFPVEPFLFTEEGDEIVHGQELLPDIPALLPTEELQKVFPQEIDEEVTCGEGSMEVQSKALAVWLADCYRELKLHTKKPSAMVALHDDEKGLDMATLRWKVMDDD